MTTGDAAFSAVRAEWTVLVPVVLPYRPGEFFPRELPPLRAVLAQVHNLGLLIIDGHADLDPDGRPGLGAHAHAVFGVPVIGVAKTRFRTASHTVDVLRGNSARPLFITASGMPAAEADALVDAGQHHTGAARLAAECAVPGTIRGRRAFFDPGPAAN